ncbi:MAG TPA: hypothetical protein VGL20_14845 [Candidatus Dormibacteraeota bacterium]|jgi:hypothetical protein
MTRTTGLLGRATLELRRSVDLAARDGEPRRRLRGLVNRIDEVIRSCEETHLRGLPTVTDDLAGHAAEVHSHARAVIEGTTAERVSMEEWGIPERVDQLMDQLWALQEWAFNRLAPWRRELEAADNA